MVRGAGRDGHVAGLRRQRQRPVVGGNGGVAQSRLAQYDLRTAQVIHAPHELLPDARARRQSAAPAFAAVNCERSSRVIRIFIVIFDVILPPNIIQAHRIGTRPPKLRGLVVGTRAPVAALERASRADLVSAPAMSRRRRPFMPRFVVAQGSAV
jgi:hypothetical protein